MSEAQWSVTEQGYLHCTEASVLVFHDFYPSGKQSGIEIIHHGERVAACGDLTLSLADGRSGGYSERGERSADPGALAVRAKASFPAQGVEYTVRVQGEGESIRLTVDLDSPLNSLVVAGASFRLLFYPPAYWGKTFHLGGVSGVFPREPNRPVVRTPGGRRAQEPMARGPRLTIAPEDPLRKMTIEAVGSELVLVDNRKLYLSEWFAVQTEVPAGATTRAVEWIITPNRVPGWRRPPVLCVSQVGYHPDQTKRAVVELDPAWEGEVEVALLRADPDAGLVEVMRGPAERWGRFLRYEYGVFDFSQVRQEGVYYLRCAGQTAGPFRIARDVYSSGVWQPTLDGFFPVQMCHVTVRDGGRCWHGACHLDDALQAPTDHEHFDGYRQGPTTDSPFAPFEHIPGLNVGGWHDAGDTDLAAGSQATTTHVLALAREEFGVELDETTVLPEERLVRMHEPDGVPDIVQQVAWGAQCLLGGYRASGHSFCGIIAGNRDAYHQIGALSTMTDNLVYDPSLGEKERTGERSGKRDDRWAFTNRDTSLEYHVAAALAAAARVLKGHEDALAAECLAYAEKAWHYEQAHPPVSFRCAYVPGHPEAQELIATAELFLTTGKSCYRDLLIEKRAILKENFALAGWAVARTLPLIENHAFRENCRSAAAAYSSEVASDVGDNPFGVPWHPHIWGVGWSIQQFAVGQYYLSKAYPDLFDPERIMAVVNFVLGCHPGGNVSFVSGVGTRSLTVAFGINRADWSYIPGGMASGTALIRPDFPELKEGFPFLWQQSEYVMPGAATYIFCVLAADALLGRAS